MDRKRCSTPPLPEPLRVQLLTPPRTPGGPQDALPRTVIPPSPFNPQLDLLPVFSKRPVRLRAAPCRKRSQTAGVKKPAQRVSKPTDNILRAIDGISNDKKSTGFMDLPGEIRNLIYSYTSNNSRQALLVYRPRLTSLRPRTQLDRHRTLASDIIEKEQEDALPAATRRSRTDKRTAKTATLARETNRPFFGLTQVCRLLRQEFRPIYMQKQEVGMDLIDVIKYLYTFYPDAPELFKTLSTSNSRKVDLPFTGNFTIAVGDKVKEAEKAAEGIDVWPLLDLWANSFKIEAGFGRYMQAQYDATTDGEAKDLYRLFGRCVQPDRRCSLMNTTWRTILRTRSLAAIRIHRHIPVSASRPARQHPTYYFDPPAPSTRPYIHILFSQETAEPWMNKEVSTIPLGWLENRGFGRMEYFDVKVGVVSASSK